MSLPLQRVEKDKREIIVKKPGEHHLNQVMKVNITSEGMWTSCTPPTPDKCDEKDILHLWYSFQKPIPPV